MSTMSKQDRDFVDGLTLVIVIVCMVALVAAIAHGIEVSTRNAGSNTTSLSATPQAVGQAVSRIEYYMHNDSSSVDPVFCGYNPATLSGTPGPSSGDKLAPGEGKQICTFADQVYYCITYGSARVYFDESRMVTPTPSPTP